MNSFLKNLVVAALLLVAGPVLAGSGVDDSLAQLQEQWAQINYGQSGDRKLASFEQLLEQAEAINKQYPDNAELLIWSGIIKSTYAGAKGGLGALKYAKASRADLEKALELDPTALNGSAYTSLGTLYFKVPGWPIGFGNDKKAEELLLKALELNKNGIDPNYFYAEFLRENGRYAEARDYLRIALDAPARPNRRQADEGRRGEILAAMAEVEAKL